MSGLPHLLPVVLEPHRIGRIALIDGRQWPAFASVLNIQRLPRNPVFVSKMDWLRSAASDLDKALDAMIFSACIIQLEAAHGLAHGCNREVRR